MGGVVITRDNAVKRTLPSSLQGTGVVASHATGTILDGLGTRAFNATESAAPLADMEHAVAMVAVAIEGCLKFLRQFPRVEPRLRGADGS